MTTHDSPSRSRRPWRRLGGGLLLASLVATVGSGCGSKLDRSALVAANADGWRASLESPSGDGSTGAVATPISDSPSSAEPVAGLSATAQPTSTNGPPTAAAGGSSAALKPTGAAGATNPRSGAANPSSTAAAAPVAPGPGGTAAASAGAGTPSAPKSEIRLGSIGIQTGPIGAVELPILQAASAWSASVNARGGLDGHPVRLITADTGGDPNRALSLARRMVEQDKVHAFFNLHDPTTEDAMAPYLEQQQVPAIGTSGGSSAVDKSSMLFQAGPGAPLGNAWATVLPALAQTKAKKASLLYCREASGCPVMADLIKSFKVFDIVHEAQFSFAQPDFTAEVISARNAGAEVVLAVADNASVVRLARSMRRQNWNVPVSTQWSGHEERFLRDGGKDIEGALVASQTAPWDTSPKMAEYREAMNRFVPNGVRGGLGSGAWVAGKLLERIAGGFPPDPAPADILNGLYSLRKETLGGLLPPTTFTKGPHARTNLCIVPIKVVNQKFVPHDGDNFTCAPGWAPPEP